MMSIMLLAALAQESPSVEELASRIGGEDSRASFRAISELSARPEEQVRAAAAKLPEFYRDALLSELKLRKTLGDHFGEVVRVALPEGERRALSHLDELKKKTGMKIAPGHWLRRGTEEAFAMAKGKLTAMEALADICEKTKHYPYIYGSSTLVLTQSGVTARPYCYRNFAFYVGSLSMWKRIDFSGRAPWNIQLYAMAVTDPGIQAATWDPDFRLIEAVTGKGVKLEAGARVTNSALQFSDAEKQVKAKSRSRGFSILLRVKGKAPEKLARLRGVATARVARKIRRFTLTEFEDLAKAIAEDELFEVKVTDLEGGTRYQPETLVHVRPRKITPEALLDLPVRVDLTYKNTGEGQTWVEGRLGEKGVEYRVRWWPYEYRAGPGNTRPTLERVVLTVPMDFVERPVYVELTDIPLK